MVGGDTDDAVLCDDLPCHGMRCETMRGKILLTEDADRPLLCFSAYYSVHMYVEVFR